MQQVLGTVNWFNLLNRPLLSALRHAYRFALREPHDGIADLARALRGELAAAALLGAFWTVRPDMRQAQELLMSDASSVYGIGGVRLPLSRGQVLQVLGVQADRQQSLETTTPHEQRKDRSLPWHPLVLDAPVSLYEVIIKAPAAVRHHINVSELAALTAVVRWSVRCGGNFHTRLLTAVDSLVSLFAAAKGRSSSRHLGRQMSNLAAVLLATGARLHILFVPTEWNMADFPSRGAPLPIPKHIRLWKAWQKANNLSCDRGMVVR